MLKKVAKRIVYYLWVFYGFVGWNLRLPKAETLTVLITYYNPARLKHVNHQILNRLKCEFVEKVVISSHNPDVRIDDHVTARDPRLVLLNQSIRCVCGYRWIVAREISPEYLIVIDDDIVLFPWQLKILFESLLEEPKIPHGLSGMVRMNDGSFQFQQRKNIEIHY